MNRFKPDLTDADVTPRHIYMNRRRFMRATGTVVGGSLIAACRVMPEETTEPESVEQAAPPTQDAAPASNPEPAPANPAVVKDYASLTDELGDPLNSFHDISNYNNYYEFTVDKQRVAGLAKDYPTSPWTVEVGGLVDKPGTYTLADWDRFPKEERIYRLRCVEAWSMVIPWTGFPLRQLLDEIQPQSNAKYVAFQTVFDPENMPGQRGGYNWPYTEGLRLDEAENDLAMLVTGLYGDPLPMQNGAPIRLIVPWKYGFKSIKSIVKIDLVEEQPTSLWMSAAPNEYGFYSNVNPNVNHPRWSQARERRIGENGRRETLFLNGYEDQVGYLYEGMDLKANY